MHSLIQIFALEPSVAVYHNSPKVKVKAKEKAFGLVKRRNSGVRFRVIRLGASVHKKSSFLKE